MTELAFGRPNPTLKIRLMSRIQRQTDFQPFHFHPKCNSCNQNHPL